ncbi:MAG: putative DNA-binding domain-containing protein [Ideonella sp.]|nr:putative DNA-binding domain-containing protein [Ideonella sp.]
MSDAHSLPLPDTALAAEAMSQRAFLNGVLGPHMPQQLPPGMAALPGPRARAQAMSGLRAYRANGLAVAHRALMAAYPSVAAMMGEDAMQVLARDLWWQAPPAVGDLGRWGAGLADWMAGFEPLAEFPWLPDCARLDWAVHCAATLADVPPGAQDLHLLAEVDPDALSLVLVPGLMLIHSPWPLAALRQAHQAAQPDAEAVAALLSPAHRNASVTLVWRQGWQTRVAEVTEAEAHLMQCLAEGQSLAQALGCVQDSNFDFQSWLLRALGQAWLSRARRL